MMVSRVLKTGRPFLTGYDQTNVRQISRSHLFDISPTYGILIFLIPDPRAT